MARRTIPSEIALMRIIPGMAAKACRIEDGSCDNFDAMARVTLETLVRPGQRVPGLLVVIEAPANPAVRIVAKRAVGPKASHMVLVLVAGNASTLCVLERRRAMAFLARYDGMQPNKREARDVVVESDLLTPAGLVVALGTADAELALVGVVLLVTPDACRRELVAIEISLVTGITLDLGMGAKQREFRRLGVVEAHARPRLGRVTRLALGAVSATMDVLHGMACSAGGRQPLVMFPNVAGGTGDLGMGVNKGESGFGMVERLDP